MLITKMSYTFAAYTGLLLLFILIGMLDA